MEKNVQGHFVAVCEEETFAVLRKLPFVTPKLHYWHNGALISTAVSCIKVEQDQLYLQENHLPTQSPLFLSFSVGENTYYIRLIFQSPSGTYHLFRQTLYRQEGRKRERLMLYPHHKAYLHFKRGSVESSKEIGRVLSFNQEANKRSLLLQSYQEKYHANRFRVLDLSLQGCAFVLGSLQRELFEQGQEFDSVTLEWMNEEFCLHQATVQYLVPYLDPRWGEQISLYKAALFFSEAIELTRFLHENYKLEDFSDETLVDFSHWYEKFFSDEKNG